MPPRLKGQAINIFQPDDITDLSVEHDRDNRQQTRPRRTHDDDDGTDYRSKKPEPADLERNWRSQNRTFNDSRSSDLRNGFGSRMSFSGRDSRPSYEQRSSDKQFGETKGGSSEHTTRQVRVNFSAITSHVGSSNVDSVTSTSASNNTLSANIRSKADEQPQPTTTTTRVSRFAGLDVSADPIKPKPSIIMRNKDMSFGLASTNSKIRRFSQDNKSALAERKAEIQREKEAQQREEKLRQARKAKLEEERIRKKQLEEEARQAELEKQERERIEQEKREQELKRRLEIEERQKKLYEGGYLYGSRDDVQSVYDFLYPAFENESLRDLSQLSEKVLNTSIPVAITFALYFRQLLNECEDIAEDYKEGDSLNEMIETRLIPVAESSAIVCGDILNALQKWFKFAEHWSFIKMQELSRVAAGAGLGRLTNDYHLTTLAYDVLFQKEVFTQDEFLSWLDDKNDKCESRVDTMVRVVRMAKRLRGEPEVIVDEDDDDDDDEDEDDD